MGRRYFTDADGLAVNQCKRSLRLPDGKVSCAAVSCWVERWSSGLVSAFWRPAGPNKSPIFHDLFRQPGSFQNPSDNLRQPMILGQLGRCPLLQSDVTRAAHSTRVEWRRFATKHRRGAVRMGGSIRSNVRVAPSKWWFTRSTKDRI